MEDRGHFEGAGYRAEERRAKARYELTAPAAFEWQTHDGNWLQGSGRTTNVGAGGAFVISIAAPDVGTPIRFHFTVHPRWNGGLSICLQGSGDVRHVRKGGSRELGFGACALMEMGSPDDDEQNSSNLKVT